MFIFHTDDITKKMCGEHGLASPQIASDGSVTKLR